MSRFDAVKKGLGCYIAQMEGSCAKMSSCSGCIHYDHESGSGLRACIDALELIQQSEDMFCKWIDIHEQLPAADVPVLICAVDKQKNSKIAITTYTTNKYGLNIEGWNPPWQYFFYDYTITHWAFLPKPPKEGT